MNKLRNILFSLLILSGCSNNIINIDPIIKSNESNNNIVFELMNFSQDNKNLFYSTYKTLTTYDKVNNSYFSSFQYYLMLKNIEDNTNNEININLNKDDLPEKAYWLDSKNIILIIRTLGTNNFIKILKFNIDNKNTETLYSTKNFLRNYIFIKNNLYFEENLSLRKLNLENKKIHDIFSIENTLLNSRFFRSIYISDNEESILAGVKVSNDSRNCNYEYNSNKIFNIKTLPDEGCYKSFIINNKNILEPKSNLAFNVFLSENSEKAFSPNSKKVASNLNKIAIFDIDKKEEIIIDNNDDYFSEGLWINDNLFSYITTNSLVIYNLESNKELKRFYSKDAFLGEVFKIKNKLLFYNNRTLYSIDLLSLEIKTIKEFDVIRDAHIRIFYNKNIDNIILIEKPLEKRKNYTLYSFDSDKNILIEKTNISMK